MLFCTWPAVAIRGPGKRFSKNYYMYKHNSHLKHVAGMQSIFGCAQNLGKRKKQSGTNYFLSALPEIKYFPLAISHSLHNFYSARDGCDGERGDTGPGAETIDSHLVDGNLEREAALFCLPDRNSIAPALPT